MALVMHFEYKVKLPDHDFVIPKQHKLVPSILGDMQGKAKFFSSDDVTYSGPTFIDIRSANHLGSSAYNHLTDMKRIRELQEFERSSKNSKNKEKLVMILTVNGAPHKNPRYEKAISYVVDYFNT